MKFTVLSTKTVFSELNQKTFIFSSSPRYGQPLNLMEHIEMSDENSPVENEIEDHLNDLSQWIDSVSQLPVEESRKGVSERFIRDCKIFQDDLNANEQPSASDLVDFVDRHNSLEIQFNNISSGSV